MPNLTLKRERMPTVENLHDDRISPQTVWICLVIGATIFILATICYSLFISWGLFRVDPFEPIIQESDGSKGLNLNRLDRAIEIVESRSL